jgi:hypothetical protein
MLTYFQQDTSEGLDVCHALEFYSRICFVENLLPLLRKSASARVISVLSGGIMEGNRLFDVNDLNLEQPGAYFIIASQIHMGVMGTLTLERIAERPENASIVFIHSHPGIVRTGNLYRGWPEESWGPWFGAIFMDPILRAFAFSFKESAERHVYQVTSGVFGGIGPKVLGIVGHTTRGKAKGGLFLVNWKCDAIVKEKEMTKLRLNAGDAVGAKVREIIGPYI